MLFNISHYLDACENIFIHKTNNINIQNVQAQSSLYNHISTVDVPNAEDYMHAYSAL